MWYTATSRRYFPETIDRVSGKSRQIMTSVRRLAVSWQVGSFTQQARVTMTRPSNPRFTVEVLTQPHATVPWAKPEAPRWVKLGNTLDLKGFAEFLVAQRLDMEELILALWNA